MVSSFYSTCSGYGKSRPADSETGPQYFITSYAQLKPFEDSNRSSIFEQDIIDILAFFSQGEALGKITENKFLVNKARI